MNINIRLKCTQWSYFNTWNEKLDIVEGWYFYSAKFIQKRSPFRNAKQILKPVLEYFLFIGSGKGPSFTPATYILDYFKPDNPKTWDILNPSSAVDSVWDKLIFSIRAKKGMPLNYDLNTYNKSNAKSIARWTKYTSGEYRGSLHIRAHS